MTAYEIIQQHPEWMKNPKGTRKAIQERAKRYIDDRKGNTNFADGIVNDLEALIRHRDAINDFADVTADDGAKRQAQVYAIFIKAVIVELNGKAICTAAQVEQWRERYGVKLDGLQVMRPKNKPAFKPFGFVDLGDDMAKKLYEELKGRIECTEEDFLWYFGSDTHRNEKEQPEQIKWYGGVNEFTYLWLLIYVKKFGIQFGYVDWESKAKRIFANATEYSWETINLSNYVSGFRHKEKLPSKFTLKTFCEEKKLLDELREKMAR